MVVLAVGGVSEVPYDTFIIWSVAAVPWSDAIIPETNEPATTAAAGNPVQLVNVPPLGVPNAPPLYNNVTLESGRV